MFSATDASFSAFLSAFSVCSVDEYRLFTCKRQSLVGKKDIKPQDSAARQHSTSLSSLVSRSIAFNDEYAWMQNSAAIPTPSELKLLLLSEFIEHVNGRTSPNRRHLTYLEVKVHVTNRIESN